MSDAQESNAPLIGAVIFAVVVGGAAIWLTVGGGEATIAPKAVATIDVSTATPTVSRDGGVRIQPEGPLKVTVSDEAFSKAVNIECGVVRTGRELPDERSVEFDVPPEVCKVILQGSTHAYGPVWGGDDLACTLDGAKTVCTGGIAFDNPAAVGVEAETGGDFYIAGELKGTVPLNDIVVAPGTFDVELRVESHGFSIPYKLVTKPGESVHLSFPAPAGFDPNAKPMATEEPS